MLGPSRDDWMRTRVPAEVDGVTGSTYIAVPDVDAHYRRAVAGGADVARVLERTSYGSVEYSVRDLEGHLWHFGDYRPVASRVGRSTRDVP